MKKFQIWASVNDYEYTSNIIVYGEKISVGEPFELNDEYRFPVFVDDRMIAFNEFISLVEEDGKEIYRGA